MYISPNIRATSDFYDHFSCTVLIVTFLYTVPDKQRSSNSFTLSSPDVVYRYQYTYNLNNESNNRPFIHVLLHTYNAAELRVNLLQIS
jgi:hypothetical protein